MCFQAPRRRVAISPTEIGDPAFNLKFDLIFRSVSTRLRHYDSEVACGEWNGTLIEDFRSDFKFIRTADELFGEAVGQHKNGECIASDRLSLETVKIDFGATIDLYFRLHFLDAPNGYGISPGKFSVAVDTTRDDCSLATLSCGLCGPDGDFWYPSSKRMSNVVMPDNYDWAYSHTRTYGPPTISSWIDRRTRNAGNDDNRDRCQDCSVAPPTPPCESRRNLACASP